MQVRANASFQLPASDFQKWRAQRLAQAVPASVEVPVAVEQASRAALLALWQAAQEQASGVLRAAQAGWEAERLESDAVNAQTARVYEAQSAALETALAEIARLQGELEALRTQMAADQVSAGQQARQAKEEHGLERARLLAMVDAERTEREAASEATRLANDQHAGEVARLNTALEDARQRHAQEQLRAEIAMPPARGPKRPVWTARSGR